MPKTAIPTGHQFCGTCDKLTPHEIYPYFFEGQSKEDEKVYICIECGTLKIMK